MVSTGQADLLDFPFDARVIAHSCNCQNTMGGGIAKQIRDRYPQAWKADCQAAKAQTNILGSFSYATVLNNPDHFVFNLYSQQFYGRDKRYVSYDALVESLQKMRRQIDEWQDINGIELKVAVPYKLSCKLAGGSWSIVEAILVDIFDKGDVDLVIVRNPIYDK